MAFKKLRGMWLSSVAVGASAMLAMALTPAVADAQSRLAMGATHSQSAFYSYQVAVVSDWNEVVEGLDMSVQELGGAAASTQALLRGEVDVGIAVTSSDYLAREGEGPFNQAHDDLRTLYYFAPLPLNWVVAAESGIESIEEIAGHDFNPGGRGSATEGQTQAVVEHLGLGVDLYRAGGSDALDAYQNRRIAGFVKAGLHPDGYIQQAHSAREIRLLSMSADQARSVADAFPYFSVGEVDSGGHYGDQPEALTTVQTGIGINTTTALSEDMAYRIVERVFSEEGIAAAKGGYPPADRVDPAELTLTASVAPLHAGVVRYFKDQGVEVPDHLIPTEYQD